MAEENKNKSEAENIFRQESLDKSLSPDVLNKYIKAATPKIWLMLVSVILILVGIIVWANVGYVEVKYDVVLTVNNGEYVAQVEKDTYEKIKEESFIRFEGKKTEIAEAKIEKADGMTAIYVLTGKIDAQDGNYTANVIIESMHPMQFVTN